MGQTSLAAQRASLAREIRELASQAREPIESEKDQRSSADDDDDQEVNE